MNALRRYQQQRRYIPTGVVDTGDIQKISTSFLGLPIGTGRSCLMKKTGGEKSRDTVPLSTPVSLCYLDTIIIVPFCIISNAYFYSTYFTRRFYNVNVWPLFWKLKNRTSCRPPGSRTCTTSYTCGQTSSPPDTVRQVSNQLSWWRERKTNSNELRASSNKKQHHHDENSKYKIPPFRWKNHKPSMYKISWLLLDMSAELLSIYEAIYLQNKL